MLEPDFSDTIMLAQGSIAALDLTYPMDGNKVTD